MAHRGVTGCSFKLLLRQHPVSKTSLVKEWESSIQKAGQVTEDELPLPGCAHRIPARTGSCRVQGPRSQMLAVRLGQGTWVFVVGLTR